MYLLRLVFVFAIAVLYNRSAEAASGYITGTFKFWNDSVNYCDASAGMNCTGAMFPAGLSNSYQPIREAKIQIEVRYPGPAWVTRGNGYTDANGNYTILWSEPAGTPGSSPGGSGLEWRIRWLHEHRDSVFRVVDNSSPRITYDSIYPGAGQSLPALVNGQTVNLGTRNITAQQPGNIYDNAWRAWNFPIKNSTLEWANFNNVQLIWPVPSVTASTNGPAKTVAIGTDWWRASLVVAHELGHVASYADGRKLTVMYNYPNLCSSGNCTGGAARLDSVHKYTAFEEGFADFIAAGTLYWFDATGPQICTNNVGNCAGAAADSNIEVRSEPCNARSSLSVTRFLWDTYDNVVDSGYADNLSRSFASAIDTLANFPNNTADGGKNEAWSSSLTYVDDEDGHSAFDYANNSAISVSTQRLNNCSP